MRVVRTALAIGMGSLLLAMAAWGHEHHDHSQATGVVKERMDAMTEMGKRMKAIGRRARSNEALGQVSDDAGIIKDIAAKIIALFPAGSTQPPTEAASAIWRNFDDFASKARALEQEAEKLATMKGADARSMAQQVRTVSEACSSCHEKYRIKQ